MRTQRRLAAAVLVVLALCSPRVASAHPVTVDGDGVEWLARSASGDNLGIVARGTGGAGEHIWRDAIADTRTDLASPETIADILIFRVTGNAAGLSFLVGVGDPGTGAGGPVQLQIAIDEDRVDASGQRNLAGFADTQTASRAAWERLVQTQLTAGNQAVVRDTAFAAVGGVVPVGVTSFPGVRNLELTVPWAQLGLSGPPATPLRFTVATFRENPVGDTVDVGGAAVSNALDVVSDYGAPGGAAPNTWTEVSDGVVDFAFDVWLGGAGDAYAPLEVARFVSDGPAASGDEWVMVRNATPAPLLLDNYRVGDEETPRGSEGMYAFPTGTTLAPGGTFVASANGAGFFATYGRRADGEWTATDPMTPDMVRYAAWGTGNILLANTGDEILVLDPSNTASDIVIYGIGVYSGINPLTPVPGTLRVATRDAVFTDTDDNDVDFTTTFAACATDATCGGGCGACVLLGCSYRAAGYACRAVAGTCDVAETCTGSAAACPADALLAAGTACRTAAGPCDVAEVCTGASAACPADAVLAAGTSCRAAAGTCDVAESCDGASAACPTDAYLAAGTVCRAAAGACDAAESCAGTGAACPANAFAGSGTPCPDGNVCNGDEACDGAGSCAGGTPLSCTTGAPCTVAICAPSSGCMMIAATAGSACDDGDACNGPDACDGASVCVSGAMMLCVDGGPPPTDAGTDAGDVDAGGTDAGSTDAGGTDAGGTDAGGMDAGGTDAGGTDAGGTDAGSADAGSTDAGHDAGARDASSDAATGGDGSTMPVSRGGCCAVSGAPGAAHGLALTALALGLAVLRRRRR